MPSPFPGMDPFIESQRWEGFHARMIVAFSELLVPRIRPTYVCDIQRSVYFMADEEEIRHCFGLTLRPPVKVEWGGLTICTRETNDTIAIIDLLTHLHKSNSEARAEYLTMRQKRLHSSAHLVEIDLRRGGTRLPCREPLPEGDYYCLVSRASQRPYVDVYAWKLRDRLPVIPVPLLSVDGDVALDLQAAFDAVYERAGYDYTLKYDAPLAPPVDETRRRWIDECIKAWRARETA
jgi:hypothetical protein